ncbi:MAG: tRNA (adenosine(37)-N6)-threonylcarbamoyltransferase complex ATPase subunit type 1 TsaE [Oscillospiraceae bacterium]|nr:tRNA (adenosine(37)-N6)-threonylcarbamoyltransferase complex ATPase subunit type 1 TsaE [Oscillospiraceae bacterium]
MLSRSEHETEEIARELAKRLPPDTQAVALTGGMGAGKTVFARGLAGGLGYGGAAASPTYTVVNEYGGIFHFDWYRLAGGQELYELGWDEYLERGLCIVEWSERAPGALPPRTVRVSLAPVDGAPEHREITIEEKWS